MNGKNEGFFGCVEPPSCSLFMIQSMIMSDSSSKTACGLILLRKPIFLGSLLLMEIFCRQCW